MPVACLMGCREQVGRVTPCPSRSSEGAPQTSPQLVFRHRLLVATQEPLFLTSSTSYRIWPWTLILNFRELVKLEPTLLDPMPTTLILRHRKENLKKCSLTPITGMKGIEFFSYPKDLAELPIVPGTIVLVMGAPPLPARESSSPLLLIDGTWRLAEVMWKQLSHRYGPLFIPYSLPACSTAYPRRQTCCDDPNEGLASIEALYLAHTLLGRPTDGLLDGYHWRESFLERNQALWEQIALEQASGLK